MHFPKPEIVCGRSFKTVCKPPHEPATSCHAVASPRWSETCALSWRSPWSQMWRSVSRGDGDGGAPASAEAGPSFAAVDLPRPGKAKAMSASLQAQSEHDLERELQRREDEAEVLGWLSEQASRRVRVAVVAVATRRPFPMAPSRLQRLRPIFSRLSGARFSRSRMPVFASTGAMALRGRARPHRGREAGPVTRSGRGGPLVCGAKAMEPLRRAGVGAPRCVRSVGCAWPRLGMRRPCVPDRRAGKDVPRLTGLVAADISFARFPLESLS